MPVKNYKPIMFLVAGITLAALSGCRSPEAKENVVIPPAYAKLMKDFTKEGGLHRAWGEPKKIRQYDKIIVEVKISPKQLEQSWWAKQNIRRLVASTESDMEYVAAYAQQSFVDAFKKSKDIKLTKTPGPGTMTLEFAIVQVIPNKPVMGAMSNLGSITPIGLILLPIKLGAKGIASDTGGAIAMESVMRDSVSGKILAVFADREKGRVALFNAKEFTAYANVRGIIDQWTANVVTALEQIKAGKKVKLEGQNQFTPVDF